ncbi:MAG TPA: SsrA-binding protein SmpB [Gammaproteobacteria bacterium]|nr:SsrA-binding protein SmpB [Gammaproteobacteria bacterium]
MAKKKKDIQPDSTIAVNRKVRHEYSLEKFFEAGLVLQGWEVKSIRAGKANISEAYIILKNGEAWIIGSQFVPLLSASTHVVAEANRTRKLLLHQSELNQLVAAVERQGYTIVPLKLFWKNGRVKCDLAIAKGKKLHDKRQSIKDREWQRSKARVLKRN